MQRPFMHAPPTVHKSRAIALMSALKHRGRVLQNDPKSVCCHLRWFTKQNKTKQFSTAILNQYYIIMMYNIIFTRTYLNATYLGLNLGCYVPKSVARYFPCECLPPKRTRRIMLLLHHPPSITSRSSINLDVEITS